MKAETERSILDEIAATKDAGGQVYAPTEFGDGPVLQSQDFSPEGLRREIERVFWRSWIPVARVSELVADSYTSRAVAGAEVLLTRGPTGEVRAFRNACRHRGSALVQGSKCGKRIVCPYHAWTYDLQGCLLAVSDPYAFPPEFQRADYGLQPVAADLAWGWVWINLAENSPPLSDFLGEALVDELANWPFETAESKGTRQFDADYNWKLAVEGFMEPNHATTVHRRTVSPFVNYKQGSMAWWGGHSRMTLMLRDPSIYEPEGLFAQAGIEIIPTLNSLQRMTSATYSLWPGTVFNLTPNHMAVLNVEPLTECRSRIKVEVFAQPSINDAQRAFWESVLESYLTLIQEDSLQSVAVQRGLTGPGLAPLMYSHYDRRIRHFREMLRQQLD